MKQSYFICATPRSGSTLLCDLLTQTGNLGRPNSFYRRQSITDFVTQFAMPNSQPLHGVDFERDYLAAITKHSTQNGAIIGIRSMWESMPEMLTKLRSIYPADMSDVELINQAFGAPTFFQLGRKDKTGQAISRAKAEQSGLWHLNADGSERERSQAHQRPEYDFASIKRYWDETIMHEKQWADWFSTNAIAPVQIWYEDLSQDPQGEVAKILGQLNQSSDPANTLRPQTARLADQTSKSWSARFTADLAQL